MPRMPSIHFRENRKRFEFNFHGRRYVSTDRKKIQEKFRQVVRSLPKDAVCVPELIELWRDAHPDVDNDWIEYMLRYWGEFERRALGDIPKYALEEYQLHLRKRGTIGPKVNNDMCMYARRVCQWGYDYDKGLKVVPFRPKPLPVPKGHKDIAPAELLEALTKLDATSRRGRIATLTRFCLGLGARPAEGAQLRWDEVVMDGPRDEWRCVLGRGKNFKKSGEKPRILPLTDEAVEQLRVAEARDGRAYGYVFMSCHRTPYTRDGFHGALKRITGFYPYQLRHTFAQMTLDQGISQDVLGAFMDSQHSIGVYSEVRQRRTVQLAPTLISPAIRAADSQAARLSENFEDDGSGSRSTNPGESSTARSRQAG